MPVSTNCPTCQALFRLPEELAGKKVKCQKCQALFLVPEMDAAATVAYSPPETEIRPPEHDWPEPKVGEKPPPPKVLAVEDDDETDREEPDDDERERRPRRRKPEPSRRARQKAAKKSGSGTLAWVLLGTGAVLLLCIVCGGAGVGVVLALRDQPGGPNQVVLGPDGAFTSVNTLTFRDPVKNNKHQKIYLAHLEAGRTYQIDMTSREVDSFLFLLDGNHQLMAANDDGGDALNARIVFRPQRTGEYRIEATSCWEREVGNFTLHVRRF